MRPVARRLVGVVALVAVLACSSIGTCWLKLAKGGHDCCEQEASMAAPVRACGTTATSVASVEVAPLALSVSVPVPPPSATILKVPDGIPAAFPVTDPPLILRI